MQQIISALIAFAILLALSLLIWSRKTPGRGMSEPPERPQPKSLEEFDRITPDATEVQRTLFYAGNSLFNLGNRKTAKRVYEPLIEELPDNPAVCYNYDLCAAAPWMRPNDHAAGEGVSRYASRLDPDNV